MNRPRRLTPEEEREWKEETPSVILLSLRLTARFFVIGTILFGLCFVVGFLAAACYAIFQ